MYKLKNLFAQGSSDSLLRVLICMIALFSSFVSADDDKSLSVHDIIVGIILLSTGIMFCFFGRRIYHLTLFLLGFYIGSILGWIILTNNEPASGYGGNNSPTIILIVSLAIGFLVGMIFICLADFAIYLLGALVGYALALFLLSWANNGIIQSKTGQIIFIVALIIIGIILIHFFKDDVIIFGTAFIGAYAIILGIDMFAQTGFTDSVRSFLDGNHKVMYNATTKVYLMLGGLLGFFILGGVYQHHRNRGDFYPKSSTHNVKPSHEKHERRSAA